MIKKRLKKTYKDLKDFLPYIKAFKKNQNLHLNKLFVEINLLDHTDIFNPEDKIYYVIKRDRWHGFFSNFNFVLMHLHLADYFGWIPIVDMETRKTFYNEDKLFKETYNSWDYYFNQTISLSQAKKSKYICSQEKFSCILSNIFYSTGKTKYFNYLMKKYIKIKDEIIEEMNSFLLINNLFHETLGVHWRGCDMTINRDGGTIPQKILFSKIDDLLLTKNYKKIFLCTDEELYIEKMKQKYGDKLIYTNAFRSKSKKPIHDNFYNRSNLINSNQIENRKFHNYHCGKEVLLDTLLLSKCKNVLGRNSNVITSAKIIGNLDSLFLI